MMATLSRRLVLSPLIILCVCCSSATGLRAAESAAAVPNRFEGKYCSGAGDVAHLKLIDESFAIFHANPDVPNLTMVYQHDWDTFCEGANWAGLWIQNSYGFSYAATPFLQEPWFSMLQRSWDLFWDCQADGKRMGLYNGSATATNISALVAPDGCLGDAVSGPGGIAYKTSDGNLSLHDWLYESTPACVVLQAEILLSNRDSKAIAYYLPKMARACDFVERARDPKTNLFLVGPGCNLLNPSYGGVRQADGTFGKGYLAGLSITYLAALDRMVELCKFAGDRAKLMEFEHRRKITRESLSQLLTPAGYFVKSVEPGCVTKLPGGLKPRRGRRLARIVAIGRFCPVYPGPRRPWRWAVPAAAIAFEPFRAELALGFRRAAADLPAPLSKRRIADHFLARRDEVQQPVGGFAFPFALQRGTPLDDLLPGRCVALVLEHVHQFVGPRAALGRFLAKNLAPRTMHVFTQVVEVQAQRVQFREMQLHLFANPRRSIHESHMFVGLAEPQSIRFATQKCSCRDMIAVREGHMLTLRVLAIEEDDLEFLPGHYRSHAFAAARACISCRSDDAWP